MKKKIFLLVAVLFVLSISLLPKKTQSMDQSVGSCCSFPGQTCSYGFILVPDHIYSTGFCPPAF